MRVVASERRLAAFAWAVLAYNLAVVAWGAFVRATGSGAGCGSHWPLCNGEVLSHSPAAATLIEFTHRATSGLAALLVAALAAWVFRVTPRRHPARRAAAAAGAAPPRRAHPQRWLAAWTLGGMVLLGVSGAIAALGDTLFPATSLGAGLRQNLSPTVDFLLRLSVLHPVLALLAAALAGFAFHRLPHVRPWTTAALLLLAAQMAAGLLNLLLLAPVWMQLIHLLLADLLWIALVLSCARADLPVIRLEIGYYGMRDNQL
jgi:heme A synthase